MMDNSELQVARRPGKMLAKMEKARGATEPGTNRGTTRLHDVTTSTLAELSISKAQSARWQFVARIPEQAFKLLLKERGVERGTKGGRPSTENPETVSGLAAELGVEDRTARNRMEAADQYGDLPKSDVAAMEKHADKIAGTQEQVRRISGAGVIAIGKELKAAQEQLAHHGDGEFNRWVEGRCGFSKRSAYNAITVFGAFGDCAKFAQSFDASALYLLSAESCPPKARKEDGRSVIDLQAVRLGWTHEEIGAAAGVTRRRIGQVMEEIAESLKLPKTQIAKTHQIRQAARVAVLLRVSRGLVSQWFGGGMHNVSSNNVHKSPPAEKPDARARTSLLPRTATATKSRGTETRRRPRTAAEREAGAAVLTVRGESSSFDQNRVPRRPGSGAGGLTERKPNHEAETPHHHRVGTGRGLHWFPARQTHRARGHGADNHADRPQWFSLPGRSRDRR